MCLRRACKSAGAGEDEPAHTSSPAPHHSATSSRAVHEYALPSHALRPSPPTPPAQSGPAGRSAESPASWHPEPAPSTATLRRHRRPPPRRQAKPGQTPRAGGCSRRRRAQAGPGPRPPRSGPASPKGHEFLFFLTEALFAPSFGGWTGVGGGVLAAESRVASPGCEDRSPFGARWRRKSTRISTTWPC